MKDRGRAREPFRRLRPNAQISRGFSKSRDIEVMRLKGIEQRRDHSFVCSTMDERVAPFVVAQSSIHAVWLRVEHENLVPSWIGELQGARQAKLERHVEPTNVTNSGSYALSNGALMKTLFGSVGNLDFTSHEQFSPTSCSSPSGDERASPASRQTRGRRKRDLPRLGDTPPESPTQSRACRCTESSASLASRMT